MAAPMSGTDPTLPPRSRNSLRVDPSSVTTSSFRGLFIYLAEFHQVPRLAVRTKEVSIGFLIVVEAPFRGVPCQFAAGPVGDVADAGDGGGARAHFDIGEGLFAAAYVIHGLFGGERGGLVLVHVHPLGGDSRGGGGLATAAAAPTASAATHLGGEDRKSTRLNS